MDTVINWLINVSKIECSMGHLILSVFALLLIFSVILIRITKTWHARLKTATYNAEQDVKAINDRAKAEADQLKKDTDSEIERITIKAATELSDEKQRSKQALVNEREAIRMEKEKLLLLSDKELLVSNFMALGGYSTRLDRIEESIISTGKSAQNHANKVSTLQSSLDSVSKSINATTPALDTMGAKLSSIITFNDKLSSDLKQLNSLVGATKDAVDSLDGDELSSLKYAISEVDDKIDSVRSMVSEIQGYSSMSSLTDISNLLDSIKSTVESLER